MSSPQPDSGAAHSEPQAGTEPAQGRGAGVWGSRVDRAIGKKELGVLASVEQALRHQSRWETRTVSGPEDQGESSLSPSPT